MMLSMWGVRASIPRLNQAPTSPSFSTISFRMALPLGLLKRASTVCIVFMPGSCGAARTKRDKGLEARGELGGARVAIHADWFSVTAT